MRIGRPFTNLSGLRLLMKIGVENIVRKIGTKVTRARRMVFELGDVKTLFLYVCVGYTILDLIIAIGGD
jgi:hypothetical protein